MASQIDIITTSLEALIQRAANVSNQGPDLAAINAFCGLVSKEPESAPIAVKLITAKLHSLQEWEALQTLLLLETCMKNCGSSFHSEVGKFRFLNELIKLVSPKYLGAQTPPPVRKRVLELMFIWTVHHPREVKIKEAYEMLKKQGVVTEENFQPLKEQQLAKEQSAIKQQSSILPDEETSQLLQKLLQSKNPHDLQAANHLIKSMVKEEERRVEEKWRYKVELQKVVNNSSLLNEMLDSFQVGVTSDQELELIKELYTTCLSLRPVLFKLANANSDPVFCNEVLTVNDELGDIFLRYNNLVLAQTSTKKDLKKPEEKISLLDLTPSPSHEKVEASDKKCELDMNINQPVAEVAEENLLQNNIDALRDVFSSLEGQSSNLTDAPTGLIPKDTKLPEKKEPPKLKGFEELDLLGEILLKQSLSKPPAEKAEKENESLNNSLLNDDVVLSLNSEMNKKEDKEELFPLDVIKIQDFPKEEITQKPVLPLGDINLTLENVKPSSVHPFEALNEKNGITTVLHLAKEDTTTRSDVSVFVVTTSSKNKSPLSNFLFQPIVPKCCRLRLLPPSSTELPAHNPFLPPSAITQLMLIASPAKEPILLKFVVSYTMEEETITEMGEIDSLLLSEST